VTRIASQTTECPTSLFSIVRSAATRAGAEAFAKGQNGIDSSFCAHVAVTGRPLTVTNAAADPRFQDNILVRGFPGIRFYSGVPVIESDGDVGGVLCVIDYEPRDTLTPAQLEILHELARLATDRLRLLEMTGVPNFPSLDAGGSEAMLLVDSDGAIVNWNTAAERLLAAYADDLFHAGARRHLPGWDDLVTNASRAPEHDRRRRPVSLVRADGTMTVAVASVTREHDRAETRFRVLLTGSKDASTPARR
jgi:PAS domain-containing protein